MVPVDRCAVCDGTDLLPYSFVASRRERLHWAQVRCTGCGLLISQPRASLDEITRFYRDTYYAGELADAAAIDHTSEPFFERYDLPLVKELWSDWPPPAGASVVDVGCGYGSAFAPLARLGYRVVGCEPSPHAVAYCRSLGRDVREGVIPDVQFDEPFDVALSLQVIEHVTDVRAFVRALVATTRPGGVVVITTEDAWNTQHAWERLIDRVRFRFPRFRSAFEHTYLFSAPHLERLLREAGCDDVRTRSYSFMPAESLHWRLYKGAFRTLDRLLGRGDWLMAVGRVNPGGRTL